MLLTINDQPYEILPGRTILEACREAGIPIPTLCFHPALKPYGACRLCMVEVSQAGRRPRLVAACVYPCEPDLQVQTETEQVHRSRRMTAELLLAEAGDNPELLALAKELGVNRVRYRLPGKSSPCILCGLCVRACQEIVGVSAISMIKRGISKKVAPPFQVASSTCIGCGTCVLVCPTSAFQFREVSGLHSALPSDSTFHQTDYQTYRQVVR